MTVILPAGMFRWAGFQSMEFDEASRIFSEKAEALRVSNRKSAGPSDFTNEEYRLHSEPWSRWCLARSKILGLPSDEARVGAEVAFRIRDIEEAGWHLVRIEWTHPPVEGKEVMGEFGWTIMLFAFGPVARRPTSPQRPG